MELFHKILKTAVDGGASDVHLKIGTPVIFRIHRQLIAIECPFPTEDWMNNVVKNVIPEPTHDLALAKRARRMITMEDGNIVSDIEPTPSS